ncbi:MULTISPECIES: protein-disulfide reductase DsbD [unclassified Modicisalibacter]|uniref:protein-disulfide reductase DsbD n=1 Tax=unclassified Modicisalibacter TaxID=2679913 RepID=UPI001CCE735B|nr:MULTISPECIES: protein-disulfide reductase DsbD [unclassified Modicisalibacter]MBZ9560323.1 protein-disulfide reductase DsbD [Modicisalibacter sp. R2A 31.J]MBZ9576232.1 protein-disulfide reductase DsbD [Modicisalibacter sp. MOD 31.J]
MRHRLSLSLSLLLLLLLALPAQAGLFDDNASPGDAETFLPVHQAFQASAWRDDDTLYVGFANADGYYLYRHRFAVASATPEVTFGEPRLPAGKFKHDDYLGDAHVFYHQVVLTIPLDGDVADDTAVSARITFQGCADAGLCYPPETLTLEALPGSPPGRFAAAVDDATLPLSAQPAPSTGSTASMSNDAASRSSVAAAAASDSPRSEDGHFSALLRQASVPTVLGLFFLAGVGLTFTPCVLPMLPILAAIIVGRGASRGRALALSGSYVAGMAVTYALVGVLMGLFGAGLNLQARLQSPWVLVPFAALFVLFALAMFGTFELRLAPGLAQRVDGWQQRLQRSGPLGLALAGALSVVVVSPCVSAPLAGAMVFMASTGDALLGGLALLALGLGMGVPLLLVGAFGGTFLPRAGAWMNGIKTAFGLLLLGVAIWLVERLLPGPLTLLLWSALAMGTALALGALTPGQPPGWPRLRQLAGLLLLGWGLALILGAAQGGSDPLRPLARQDGAGARSAANDLAFVRVTDLAGLERELDRAARLGQPAFVDVTADWCISCRIMEREVFPAPSVAARLADYHRIRADVTDTGPETRALLDRFGLFGPPGLLFFRDGRELGSARIQGEVDAEALSRHLRRLAGSAPKATPAS